MNTDLTWRTVSTNSENTFAIGEQLGRACKGGEVFMLVSDLGGGKTTLTKGLARGLGSTSVVTSPTFTVSKVYPCREGLALHHFDFYRLQEGGMVGHELEEVLQDSQAITVLEWGEIAENVLPAESIQIKITRTSHDVDERAIFITYPEKFRYVVGGLK